METHRDPISSQAAGSGLEWRNVISRVAPVAVAVVLLLLPGCSSFPRQWREAAVLSDRSGDITGRWEGTWQNSNNTHRDRMQAIITRVGPATYRASFHAWYKRILTFSYAVNLTRIGGEGDRVTFRGEANLGRLAGGVYKYDGWAAGSEFHSTYDSKYDVGTFTMRRVRD